jgi:hypothetical protein
MPSTVPDHNMNIFPLSDVHASALHRRNAGLCSFQPTALRLHNLLPLANLVCHPLQPHSQPLVPCINYAKPLRNRFLPIQIP